MKQVETDHKISSGIVFFPTDKLGLAFNIDVLILAAQIWSTHASQFINYFSWLVMLLSLILLYVPIISRTPPIPIIFIGNHVYMNLCHEYASIFENCIVLVVYVCVWCA